MGVHTGKKGLFCRLTDHFRKGQQNLANHFAKLDILDGVMVPLTWADTQKTQGRSVDLSSFISDLNFWTGHGKQVFCYLVPWSDNNQTPIWVKNVVPAGAWMDLPVTPDGLHGPTGVPQYWYPGFADKWLIPWLQSVAKQLLGLPLANQPWYYHCCLGHTGNLIVESNSLYQPYYSQGAYPWNLADWTTYCDKMEAFTRSTFGASWVQGTGCLFQPKDQYAVSSQQQLVRYCGNGSMVSNYNFGNNQKSVGMQNAYAEAYACLPSLKNGTSKWGGGDDFPLYNPKAGKDITYLKATLDNCFSGVTPGGVTFDIPTSFILVQEMDMMYACPGYSNASGISYNPDVHSAFASARSRLAA